MFIVQIKNNSDLDNYVDISAEEKLKEAKETLKKLVGLYQSQGRILEVRVEAEIADNDYIVKEKYPQNEICKRDKCLYYEQAECKVFADASDPILNSNGECQAFKEAKGLHAIAG